MVTDTLHGGLDPDGACRAHWEAGARGRSD